MANLNSISHEYQHTATVDLLDIYMRDVKSNELLTAEQEIELAKQIEVGLYAGELLCALDDDGHPQRKEAMALTGEERMQLTQLQQDGHTAKIQMIKSNTPLVVFWAKKYDPRGMCLLDLIQEGNIGLMRAVDGFDYKKGYKFSVYASQWIRKHIMLCIANQSRTIRVPTDVYEQYNKIQRIKREMAQEYGEDPSIDMLAERVNINSEKIITIEASVQPLLSLDKNIEQSGGRSDEDSITFIDTIDARLAKSSVEDSIVQEEFQDEMNQLLASLNTVEQQIIKLHHGFGTGQELTHAKIGAIIGKSTSRVSEIERSALKRLRDSGWIERLMLYADIFDSESNV